MIIVAKSIAILNLTVKMARLLFFQLNKCRGIRRKPMGNQCSISASMRRSLGLKQKGSEGFSSNPCLGAWQTAPESWSEKNMRTRKLYSNLGVDGKVALFR